jgi:MoaA/NifB/PqqE/SkfB family radical SAM enzyme
MEDVIIMEQEKTGERVKVPFGAGRAKHPIHVVNDVEKIYVGLRIWLRIAMLAFGYYGAGVTAANALKKLWQSTKELYGGKANIKLIKNNGKYFYNIYTPGFPSVAYDNFIRNMFSRLYPAKKEKGKLSFLFFAITRKCPLHCEHCFEADNLNGKETFTLEELQQVVADFQKEDVTQFHLSGGEPMVRMNDLEKLVAEADKKSEFWVLTSGFNLTKTNAERLKKAGVTGVVVSLDHFEPKLHDAFRGFPKAYQLATEAIVNARESGLVTAATICVTKTFLTRENLMRYASHVKGLGVHFVQVLEPKPVGAYKGKNVALSWQQFQLLEDFYKTMNFDPAYKDFPPVIYHGYHQRRTGCNAGGYSNLYIDSTGYVNGCPFCSTRDYNIKDVIGKDSLLQKQSGCSLYNNAGATL